MLWDRGTWEPHVDVGEGLRKGSLKFAMHGEKMKGNWALVRMVPRPGDRSGKSNWLLIKEHDALERAADATPITEEAPDSVLSGREMDAIAHAQDRVRNSNREEKGAGPALVFPVARAQSKRPARDWSSELRRAPKEALPKFIDPQLASQAKSPPSGDRWFHEPKLDGYRIQIRIDGKKHAVQLLTRNGLDWTHRMKALADAALRLWVKSALIDGEVVVLTPQGTSSFAELQASFQGDAGARQTYFAFDLLHLDGHNLRNLPLLERKRLLAQVLGPAGDEIMRFSQHIEGDGGEIFRKSCELGSEGIVSKLADGKYLSGRGGSWLKSKCYREQEFVIGGFTPPTNSIHRVGALLLGYYEHGKLVYAGRTGTGFTQKMHRHLRDRLEKIRAAKTSFAKLPPGAAKDVLWVKPELVAQVSFTTWTADNIVRQAAFKGLREDKPAKSVVREEPMNDSGKASHKKQTAAKAAPKKTASAKPKASDPLPIRLTHPDKILDESSGVTKEALAR
jgi:bifunctional non-homologous end joining protein LigD